MDVKIKQWKDRYSSSKKTSFDQKAYSNDSIAYIQKMQLKLKR
jgi:hypothetical protein